MKNEKYLLIAGAGVLWGTLGLFGKLLMGSGLKPEQVAFCRLFFGSIILVTYAFFKMPEALKIKRRGIIYSLIIGLISQAIFNLTYFNAIKSIGAATAAVLLYTAPVFLAIFSKVFYNEHIELKKIASLLLCFSGSFIAATGGSLDMRTMNLHGILFGIGAAIAYALMPIFSKTALKNVSTITLTIYSFIFGWIFMMPLAKPWQAIQYAGNLKILFLMIGLGLLPSALSYLLYMSGISKGVELSRAGVISSVELIVSVAIAWLIMGESFSIMKFIGLSLMLLSIIVASHNAEASESSANEAVKEQTTNI